MRLAETRWLVISGSTSAPGTVKSKAPETSTQDNAISNFKHSSRQIVSDESHACGYSCQAQSSCVVCIPDCRRRRFPSIPALAPVTLSAPSNRAIAYAPAASVRCCQIRADLLSLQDQFFRRVVSDSVSRNNHHFSILRDASPQPRAPCSDRYKQGNVWDAHCSEWRSNDIDLPRMLRDVKIDGWIPALYDRKSTACFLGWHRCHYRAPADVHDSWWRSS